YLQATGEVTSIPVGVGQTVGEGDVLAVLDDAQAQYEISQLETALTKAQAALRDLNATGNEALRAAQVEIAENNVTIAQQSLTAAQDTLARLQKNQASLQALFDAGAAAQAELDEAADAVGAQEKAVTAAAAQLDSARRQLAIAGMDTQTDLTEKITMAQADIESIEGQIAFARSQLENYTVRALENGVVVSIAYDEGGLALSGTEICEVSKEDQKYFVFYLPEEYVDYVDYGAAITVTSKDDASRTYRAAVEYIDLEAQYTPKEAESSANKNRLSFKVRALLEPGSDLRVAQKASVTLGE
ncbi:MAG TPA: HlyD family efflux transporter periplasmic adaptor subunit, partial [Oscillospiraceae bacterium]|nr:HlyD family efflux transporter periplasmic adaptor subunit [Oscillospiraceae bacterium]